MTGSVGASAIGGRGSLLAGTDFQMFAEAIPHVVWLATPDGATVYVNRQGTDYAGGPAGANHAWDWVSVIHPEDAETARSAWRQAVQRETPYAVEYRIQRFDGAFRWHGFRALPMRDAGGRVAAWIGTGTDIDDHRRLELSLRRSEQDEEFQAAVMDNMAEGLYTLDRDGLVRYLNRAASEMLGWAPEELRGKPMHETVHFQTADGTLSPSEECRLLRVRTEGVDVRVADETFTRMDGTTFPVAYSASPLRVGSAVRGLVVVFRDVTDELGETARAMRELAKLSWVGRIRDALDEGRFVLYSQPIVPLGDGEPSEELLLRMIGPSGNAILPGSFLPVAEKYGLVGEIDRWVVTEAVHLAASGRRVEVNLSAVSIETSDMLGFIERKLHETGADPANIVFEITESTLMFDLDAGVAFARGVARLGCRFALDDFGTGFGSFTYLKRLAVDFLKIDIEFVRDLTTNPPNLHLVRAIVSLAHAFGLRTIAEGVEDEGTAKVLRKEHVDFAQGFYFGCPAAIDSRHGPARMDFAGLSIDTATREVRVDGRVVELASREFDVLALLAAAPRRVFSREQLLVSVWHSSSDWQTQKTVTEHVGRIRHKIELDPSRPRWIISVRGAGYRFED